MTEEFDALQAFNPFSTIGLAIGLLALGMALEVLLRLARRWAIGRDRPLAAVILGALRWLPLFWCVLFGAALLLAGLSDVSTERQRGIEILWALFLISLTVFGVRILTGWVKLLTADRPSASVSILNYLINGVGLLIILTVALYAFNVSVPLLLLTVVASTFGLSVAFREPLANLFAGTMLTASSRVSPGDFVRLPSGEEGHVVDIEWDVTTIQQLWGSQIIVPNSVMAQAEIINYHLPEPEIAVRVGVGVSYESDLEKVERVTIEVAEGVMREVSGGVPESSPYIRYTSFGDSQIQFTVFLRGRKFADHILIRHELVKRLHRRYQEEGIVIPFPIRTLHTPPDKPLAVAGRDVGPQAANG
jgi:small-conductance mechanosensitive channel